MSPNVKRKRRLVLKFLLCSIVIFFFFFFLSCFFFACVILFLSTINATPMHIIYLIIYVLFFLIEKQNKQTDFIIYSVNANKFHSYISAVVSPDVRAISASARANFECATG